MKYILLLLLIPSFSGCISILCDELELCDRELSEAYNARPITPEERINYDPVIDWLILTEHKRLK